MIDKILGEEKVSTLFIKYTIPAVLSMILASSQTMIDGLFVGRYAGTNALASVNIATPFVQVAMAVSMIIAFGALSILGRALGAKRNETAQNAFRTALIMLLTFGISYACVGLLFTDVIAGLLGANEALLPGVVTYIRIIAVFLPTYPIMILTGFSGRLIGRPDSYLKATIGSLIVNVTLDYFLIAHMNMGLFGAALATGIAFFIGCLIAIYPLLKRENVINIYSGRIDKTYIGQILYNGSSEGIGSASNAFATFLFNVEFMKYAGVEGVAAFTAISYLVRFGIFLIFGIADGISPIVSYNYGQGQYDRVNTSVKYAVRTGFAIGMIMLMILTFNGEKLASLFAKGNAEVIRIAALGSRIYALAFLFNSVNIIYSVYFTSLGMAGTSAIIALSRGAIGIALGLPIWKYLFGIQGVWMTVPMAEVVTVIIVFVLAKRNVLEIHQNKQAIKV